jgi:uncharacterized protein (TIGR02118 family)
MVKLTAVLHARSDVDREEALRYWMEVHGPLAADLPHIRRYVQNHCFAGALGAASPPFLGIAEAWWDSMEDAEAALASEAFRVAFADVAKFLDVNTFSGGWCTEVEMVTA